MKLFLNKFLVFSVFFIGAVFVSNEICSSSVYNVKADGAFDGFADNVLRQALIAYIQQIYQENETRDVVAAAFDIADGSVGPKFEDRMNDLVVAMKNVKGIRDVLIKLYNLQSVAAGEVERSRVSFDRAKIISSSFKVLTGLASFVYFASYFVVKFKLIFADSANNMKGLSALSFFGLSAATTASDIFLGVKQDQYLNKVKSLENEEGEFSKKSSGLQQELFARLSAYIQNSFLKIEKGQEIK